MFGIGSGILKSLLFDNKETVPFLTAGTVMDTNDPDQMGRVKVRCAKFGDKLEKDIEDYTWALPISPLAGTVTRGVRGVEQESINAPVAYGMWNVPKVGATVLVGCIDGVLSKRFYLGGMHSQFLANTMPHGRYMWDHTEKSEKRRPEGPLASNEIPIEPLYSNITQQFTAPDAGLTRRAGGTPTKPRTDNAEYMSRGADVQASATDRNVVQSLTNNPGGSRTSDHTQGEKTTIPMPGGERIMFGPGYTIDHMDPEEKHSEKTGNVNYDSTNYSWTTPGFHSFSMNDRHDQCRIRLRTTSGHQIILDDTNERIYVSTAGGRAYVEIDTVGNIDIFSEKTISTHAKGDINFYSDQSIRLQAIKGIHMRADEEIRMHSGQDFHIKSDANFRTYSLQETRMESQSNFYQVSHGVMSIRTTSNHLNIKAGDQMRMQSNTRMSLKSQSDFICGDAQQIHWNSAFAYDADDPSWAHEKSAFWNSRVPDHEPWARVYMKKEGAQGADNDGAQNADSPSYGDSPDGNLPHDNTHIAEFSYADAMVGKGSNERSDVGIFPRNKWWRR